MKKNPNKLWIIVIVLGWLFDFLFWKQSPGVNFAIFATLCVAAAFYLLLSDGLRPQSTTLFLLPLFGFFAVVTFIRAEPMTIFLAYTFTLFSMLILAVTYLGGRWLQYTLVDYLSKSLGLIGSMIVRPIAFTLEIRKDQAEAGGQPSKYNLWPVVRGLVIALPIVAIFASLLASADVVFGQRLKDLMDLFNLQNLPQYIFRLVYILVIAYGLAGVILHASTQSSDEKLIGQEKPLLPAFLGFIESAIILGCVVVLFASFVVVQFQYFFGGHANINVAGYTYSQYARRGFGELVAVAFISLLMLLALSAITKRETATQRRVYSGLGVALVLFLLVMLVSAYQRLGLYEAAYGFSRLRTYTHVFLVWIGLLLLTTIVFEVLHKERLFTLAMLVASLGFAASLPILNVDGFIVHQNIQREVNGASSDYASLDAQYFLNLSDDAVPALTEAYQDTSLPAEIHEKIGAALLCVDHTRGQNRNQTQWQSFHLAHFTADRSLAALRQELSSYTVADQNWPTTVFTPSGREFKCGSYYYD